MDSLYGAYINTASIVLFAYKMNSGTVEGLDFLKI